MKKISIMIPCYNEVDNVEPISLAVVNVFEGELSRYDYEIVFIDNCSTDGTREKLETIIYRFCKSYGLPLPRRYCFNSILGGTDCTLYDTNDILQV